MQFDSKTVVPGDTIECDLCVIGAGPAGLAIASAFAGSRVDVVVLESGGASSEAAAQRLNEGRVVGDAYAGLVATRHRQIGGTAAVWNTRTSGGVGAKFTPLDRIDLESRQAGALPGWPFSFDELEPWYAKAQTLAGLGPFRYDEEFWTRDALVPLADTGDELRSAVYQIGSRDALLAPMLRSLRVASNVRLISHATAVQLQTDGDESRVSRVEVRSAAGDAWFVAARRFVMCTGAIENARILLNSAQGSDSFGNGSGLVGRCFMEHPRDRSLEIRSLRKVALDRLAFYDAHEIDGTTIVGRLKVNEDAIRSDGLLNASATLLPIIRTPVRMLRSAAGPFTRMRAVDNLLPRGGHGWSRHPWPRTRVAGFTVLLNLEQAPDPENRIVLGKARDALGLPLPELHWRWRARDEHSRQTVRTLVASALARGGLGVVRLRNVPLDPNAHHHAGTTRMSVDPRHGVVDPDGRVHGLENLYVAGASTFPTAGFANPALTILALALRLADHLRNTP